MYLPLDGKTREVAAVILLLAITSGCLASAKKPDIKCSECPNRQHKALDDQAIYDHLAGKHIVGLYPLLPDNTCHLLAADFDKDGWQDAVKAMSEACSRYNIPHLVEI